MIKHSCKDAGRSVAEPFDKVGRYGRDAQEKKISTQDIGYKIYLF